jgi:hypothetical protein
VATSGSFLDLKEWACRFARFDSTNAADLALAANAVNDAYMSTCSTGDPWDFLEREGQWLTTAGSDTYSYSSIATAMSVTGASIAEIETITDDEDSVVLQSMDWTALEHAAISTQDNEGNGRPYYWSKWESRIRLYPCPDAELTMGSFCRLTPTEMTDDADEPLVPFAWRRRLLVPYAAATLLHTEGGLETASEAERLMRQYNEDFLTFRAAYATAKKPTFRVMTPGFEMENPVHSEGGWV